MTDIEWLSIEIGHVAKGFDSGLSASERALLNDPQVIMSKITCTARNAWALGGKWTNIDTGNGNGKENDDWVAMKLEEEINNGRFGNAPRVTVNKDDFVAVLPGSTLAGKRDRTSDQTGTQCRLRGDRWINVRTYVLTNADGSYWLKNELTASHVAVATLVWHCHQLDACDLSGNAKPKA
jgi:hypothetical protein